MEVKRGPRSYILPLALLAGKSGHVYTLKRYAIGHLKKKVEKKTSSKNKIQNEDKHKEEWFFKNQLTW